MKSQSLKAVLRYAIIAGLFSLPFVAIVVFNQFFFPFITGKNFLFRTIIEFITCLWIILALLQHEYLPKKSRILQMFLVFLGVMFISNLLSPNSFKSFWSNFERMEGFVTLAHLFALFVVAGSVFRVRELWHKFFHVSIGVGVFLFLYSLLQLGRELVINQGGVRIDGTLGNATYLAVFMLFLAFFTIFVWMNDKEVSVKPVILSGFVGFGLSIIFPFWRYVSSWIDFYWVYGRLPTADQMSNVHFLTGPLGTKVFWLSIVALIALGILWAYQNTLSVRVKMWIRHVFYALVLCSEVYVLYNAASRGAQIGFLVGLMCVAVALAFFERERKVLRNVGRGLLIAIIFFGGLFIVFRNSDFVRQNPSLGRLSSFADQFLTFDKKVICEGELKSRCLLMPMAFEGVKERPIFGWGQESFNYVFNKYYRPEMYSQEAWFDRTHNVFFDWLIAGGILGLLSYLSLFGFAIYYLWRPGRDFSFSEKSVLTGLLAGYFVNNLTVFDNITSYVFFVVILAYIHSSVGETSERLLSKVKEIDRGILNRVIFPLVSVSTVFIFYMVNVPAARASAELIMAIQSLPGGPELNLGYFKKALSRHSFGDSEIREQLVQMTGQVVSASGVDLKIRNDFYNLTKSEMEKQLERSPEDARYFLFAGILMNNFNEHDKALDYFMKAHELSPKKQAILFSVSSVYLNRRDFGNALKFTKQAYDLDPSYSEARRIYGLTLVYTKDDKLAGEILATLPIESILGDPRFLQAFFVSGYFDQALASVNFMIEKDPNSSQNFFSRAAINYRLGKIKDAIADLTKAAEINPAIKDQVNKLISDIRAGKQI